MNRGELRGVKGHVVQRLVADTLGAKLGDVRHDADAQGALERLQGDASRNAQGSGEAPGEVAAARDVVVVAVAKICRVVGVPRARDAAQTLIVLASRVRVLDDGRERRSAGVAVHEAGEDSGAVGLATSGCGVRAAGGAALEKGLQLVEVNLDARRQPLDDAADGLGVRLAKDGEANGVSDTRCHG